MMRALLSAILFLLLVGCSPAVPNEEAVDERKDFSLLEWLQSLEERSGNKPALPSLFGTTSDIAYKYSLTAKTAVKDKADCDATATLLRKALLDLGGRFFTIECRKEGAIFSSYRLAATFEIDGSFVVSSLPIELSKTAFDLKELERFDKRNRCPYSLFDDYLAVFDVTGEIKTPLGNKVMTAELFALYDGDVRTAVLRHIVVDNLPIKDTLIDDEVLLDEQGVFHAKFSGTFPKELYFNLFKEDVPTTISLDSTISMDFLTLTSTGTSSSPKFPSFFSMAVEAKGTSAFCTDFTERE